MLWSGRYVNLCAMCDVCAMCVCVCVLCVCAGVEVGETGHASFRYEAHYFYSQQEQRSCLARNTQVGGHARTVSIHLIR